MDPKFYIIWVSHILLFIGIIKFETHYSIPLYIYIYIAIPVKPIPLLIFNGFQFNVTQNPKSSKDNYVKKLVNPVKALLSSQDMWKNIHGNVEPTVEIEDMYNVGKKKTFKDQPEKGFFFAKKKDCSYFMNE